MRQRRAYIQFPTMLGVDEILFNNQKRIDGVNIRFKTKVYSSAGMPMSSDFTIYNLNKEDIEYLTTCAATWQKKQNLMQLYAGYDDNVTLLASGQITEAIPQGNPDIGISVHMINGVKWWGENITIQKSGAKIIDLIQAVADSMGWAVDVSENLKQSNDMLSRLVDNFSYTGSPFDALKLIQAKVGGFNMDGRGINISTCNDVIYVWSTDENKGLMPVLLINKNTGMVGYPHPTTAGVSVKMLLNPNVRPGQLVRIESDRIGFISGEYYITSLEHEGELRGNSWYTTLNCCRPGGLNGQSK